MDNKRTNLGIVGAFALTAILSACGGGGGSSSGGGGSSSAGGTAAKGIISGAVVTGYRADGTEIGHTFTAEDGSYELELNGYKGPVRLVLTPPAAPDVALVTCDASVCRAAGADDEDSDHDGMIRFGERYVLDYELTAVVNVDKTAKTVSAHITPLTTLVERRATAGGAVLQPETIAVANSFVRQVMGLDTDPALVKPVDLTDAAADASDERALRYAVLNAAFEGLARDSARDIGAMLNDIAGDFHLNQVAEHELGGLRDAMADVAAEVVLKNDALAAAVDTATAVATADLEGATDVICSGAGDCQVEVVLDGKVGTNLQAAKDLVASARAVTIGALQDMETKLDPESIDYDSGNVIAQAQQLAMLNGNTEYLAEAFFVVAPMLIEQAMELIEQAMESALDPGYEVITDLREFIKLYYHCEWDCEDVEDFAARFSGTISRNGSIWSLTSATYLPDVPDADPVSLEIELSLPVEELMGAKSGPAVLDVSASMASGDDRLSFERAHLTLELANNNGMSVPKSIALDAQAEITDGNDSFSGGFRVEARRSAAHANLNPESELMGLMPKLFALNGTFTDGDTGNDLELEVTLNVTNAEQYRFIEEGYERNDLTTWVYNDDNTITVTHGLAGDRIVVKLMPRVHEWGEGNRDAWVEAQIISSVGDAWMDGTWPTRTEGDGYWETADSLQPCWDSPHPNGWFWLRVEETCYEWKEDISILDDARNAFRNSWIREILTRIYAYVPGEGVYQAAPQWDEDYEMYGEDIAVFTGTSGKLVATLDEAELDVNANNRYAKLDFIARLEGHLAPSLPAMTIRLTGKRTGYSTALAGLTLGWDGAQLNIGLSSSNPGGLTLDDGHGTTMLLTPGEGDVIGHIEKDGTVYGTIRRENDVYLISWLDGGFETIN